MIIKDTLTSAFNEIWPLILICTIIFSTIRIFSLIYNKEKIIIYKEILSLIFIIYVLALFHIVTSHDVSYGTHNYIPFKEIFRFPLFSYGFNKNIIGNILLFMPLGFFTVHYIKNCKIFPILIISTISSLTIEFSQKYIGRTFDIDDIILNIIGGILGYFLYIILEAIQNKLPKFFKSNLFLNILVICLLILFLSYNFNLFGGMKI